MNRSFAAGYAIGLVLLMAGCSQAPPPAPPDTRVADEKAIRDVDKILSYYADDATLMIPDMPLIKGRDAMKPGLTALLTDKNVSLSFVTSTVEVSKSGDLAYTQGTYSMTHTDPKSKKVVTEKGKSVTVYKKQADGSWKAIEDINNEDAPAI